MPNIILQLLGESATQLSPEAQKQINEAFQSRIEEVSKQRLDEAEQRYAAERLALVESHTKQLTEQEQTLRAEYAEKIDKYLSESVIHWANENAPAIDSRLKTEAAETVLVGLKNVLAESGINVDQDSKQIVETLNAQLAESEARANTAEAEVKMLRESENAAKRESVILQICEGMSMTGVDQIRTLTEGLDATDATAFGERVRTFRKLVEGEKKDPKDPEGKDKEPENKGKEPDNKKGSQLDESIQNQIAAYRQFRNIQG